MKILQVLVLMLVPAICALGSRAEAARPKSDANGAIGAEAGAVSTAVAPTTVCLELHNGGAVFSFRLTINPNAHPFKVTGGKIKGALCDAAHWKVTGGSLSGRSPLITAQYMGSASCAETLVVHGTPHSQPPSWGGTYVFDASTTYTHQTLFLGYVSCP